MAEKKVTTMVLKVDLQCPTCYRKIKKVLAKFPQIRNEAYDEKQNTVTITVVCCSPEKIRDKLCCKGGKTIKSIEIKPPPKAKPPPEPKAPEKPKAPDKAPERPKIPQKSKGPPKSPDSSGPHDQVQTTGTEKLKTRPQAPTPLVYVPIYPAPVCYGQCYEGIPGAPCYEGYERPVASYDGYGYGGNGACYEVSRCDEYFNEGNTSGCTIM
ncbi:protein PYRICULARIA ORYZAE RESISTANCE 21-like isoform X1 [Rhododendron vialii]|uniref:protein PYRICULARIA ORYZAE RESISTANCE 21-like isoform X1 n=2 Tax=Rhododendron vialii TaxID=182163 RepID=UPI00265F3D47|nr:protein PYRICULARIA ORYZAE RESISTANCE 21-like isoform X1 [Rhododendron vialii]